MRHRLNLAVLLALVFVACGDDNKPTAATTPTGACCADEGSCTVTTEADCAGTWTHGSVCDPNHCPQPPVPEDSLYLPQTSPANVFANFQTAYAQRDPAQYAKLFAEDFTFVFDPLDPVDPIYPNPESWGLADEMRSTRNMFASEWVDSIALVRYTLRTPVRADSLLYGARAWNARVDEVRLRVHTRTEDGDRLTLVVEGTHAAFYLRQVPSVTGDGNSTWYIFRWEDRPRSGAKRELQSWGVIKGMFWYLDRSTR